MKPTRPVISGRDDLEITLAKNQPEYRTLPVVIWGDPLTAVSRWKLTWCERIRICFTGNLWIQQMTFGEKLQPQLPSVTEPNRPYK